MVSEVYGSLVVSTPKTDSSLNSSFSSCFDTLFGLSCRHSLATPLIVRCLIDQSKTPYLAVYIYEAGSAFEVVMNGYMITGKGISPYNPRRLGVEGVALNATLLVATSAGEIAATGTGTGVESVRMSRLPPPMSAGLAGVDVQ